MAAHFRKKGLPVPEVYICSEDKNCYLQEDLGDILLFNAIEKGGRPASSPKRRKKCCARPSAYCLLSNLPEQTALIFTLLSPSRIQPTFYPWDLNYFKYCFWKLPGWSSKKTSWKMTFKNEWCTATQFFRHFYVSGFPKQKRDDKGWSTLVHWFPGRT